MVVAAFCGRCVAIARALQRDIVACWSSLGAVVLFGVLPALVLPFADKGQAANDRSRAGSKMRGNV